MSDKMATLVEDPVTFLASLSEECPDVLYFLTTNQVKLLGKSPSDTYKLVDVNEEFLTDMACHHAVRYKSLETKSALSSALLTPMAKNKELEWKDLRRSRKF